MNRLIDDIANELLNVDSTKNPVDYEWNSAIFRKMTYTEEGNNRLRNAICNIGYKATIGLAASLFELIYCRLADNAEITAEMAQTIKYKIDATWMAAMDPLLSEQLYCDLKNEPRKGHVLGPLWIVLAAIEELSIRFVSGSYFIHHPVVGIALLAEHISPDKKLFREWFSQVLKKAAETYPCNYKYGEFDKNAEYDYSVEFPVLREFYFRSDATWDLETVKQRVREYIQADGERNPYFRFNK